MTLAKPATNVQLCKYCKHCVVDVEHVLHGKPYHRWEIAECAKTGQHSYVTGQRINMESCQRRRTRMDTPTCQDYEEQT